MVIIFLICFLSICLFIFSYLWVDHGLVSFLIASRPQLSTLFDVIKFTNENRMLLSKIYLVLAVLFLVFQISLFIPKIIKRINKKILFLGAILVAILSSFSFPFLSRDIFTYYFSSKMVLYYHVNPYIVAPIEFLNKDLFVGLVHNIASPYLYGRGFLLYTVIIMMVTSYQRVLTFFALYKLLNVAMFLTGGMLIYRLFSDKRIFAIWFFNPYLLLEWLVNGHNDVIMAFFFILAFYLFSKRKRILAGFSYLYSILIKFVSALAIPVAFLDKKWRETYLKLLGLSLPVLIQLQSRTVEPWYFLWSYKFLPFARLKALSWILFSLLGFILTVNYYGFLESGGWGMGNIIPHPEFILTIVVFVIFVYEYWELANKNLSKIKTKLVSK